MKKVDVEIKMISLAEAKKLRLSEFNRDIRQSHVATILNQLINSPETMAIIEVTDYGVVLDGSHRLMAFIAGREQGSLSKDVKLVARINHIDPNKERELVMAMNSGNKPYVLEDYVKMSRVAGNESVSRLVEWCAGKELCRNSHYGEGKVKPAFGAAFLVGKRCDTALKRGTFELTPEDIETGNEIYAEIDALRKELGWPAAGIHYDIWAKVWRDYRDRHSFESWLNEFSSQKRVLAMQVPTSVAGFRNFLDAVSGCIVRKGRAAVRKNVKETKVRQTSKKK